LDELAGHVAHAREAGGTKAHWQDAKITLDATFVIGVVATTNRALMIVYCFLPGHVLENKLNSRSLVMIRFSSLSTLRCRLMVLINKMIKAATTRVKVRPQPAMIP
jgi:hypothetical protein